MPDLPAPQSDVLMYQTEDGHTRIGVRLAEESVWLTQASMAELFQTSVPNVSIHLRNVYEDEELSEEATVKDYLIVRAEGRREVRRLVKHYNLDAVIAVGYRVRSHRGTQFRRWATERLREYLVTGFTLDDERLKEVRRIGADYFDEPEEKVEEALDLVSEEADVGRVRESGVTRYFIDSEYRDFYR